LPDDFDVTQNIKLVEKLKSELLSSVSELFSDMLVPINNNERAQTLADIIIFTYILADKLGITNTMIDSKAASKLKLNIVEQNILYTQSVNLLKHITRSGGTHA
jgi:hypothetical protein